MASPPKVNVHLETHPNLCLLDGKSCFSLVVLLKLDSERPVSFLTNGSGQHTGLAQLLTSNCIECYDTESGERVLVLNDEKQQQSKDSNADRPEFKRLEPKRTNYITFTNDTNPKAYEFKFVSKALRPDRSYTIRCNAAALEWWSYESLEELTEYFDRSSRLPTPETPPLRLEPDNTVSFNTRAAMDEAPRLDVSLSAPSTLSISGTPPFEYSVTITSQATRPITVRYERQGLESINLEIEILDVATRKRVAPDLIDINEDDRPLVREDFLRLNPGEPHVERNVLDPSKRYSGLEDLKIDTDYVLHVFERRLWWSYDGIDEAIKDAGKRGTGGLGPTHAIDFQPGNELGFRTVR